MLVQQQEVEAVVVVVVEEGEEAEGEGVEWEEVVDSGSETGQYYYSI